MRAGELANTYGRVAIMSNDVGLSFDETNAALASLTIQGTKYNEAMTFLRNVVLKLAKPTKEMRKLFDDWGVASGQAAVKTFGFDGVIQKLAEHANGSSEDLVELFSTIRGYLGIAGLVNGGFDETLMLMKTKTNQYSEAIDLRMKNQGE